MAIPNKLVYNDNLICSQNNFDHKIDLGANW